MSVSIAVDCMGGDYGLKVTLPAAIAFAASHPQVQLILVGQKDLIETQLAQQERGASVHPNIQIEHASEVVSMQDSVEVALRKKRDSSIRVAADAVKSGRANALVSAGNTGALMAISRYVLKTLPGIERPAIATELPNTKGGSTIVLDLGANAQAEPLHLLQFAVMGAALAAAVQGKERARIGLLNIGEELIKGNDVVKAAGELLRSSPLNFIGNVEGNDIFNGDVDVVVCDGFVGNVALKSSEGVAQMIKTILAEEFDRNFFTRAMKMLAAPALLAIKNRVDHRRYNGAALLGLNGVVIKSHGSMDAFGFECAIKKASDAVEHQILQRTSETILSLHQALNTATSSKEEPLSTPPGVCV